MMEELPLSRIYRLIEPGPVVLVTTVRPGERPNIMTMSYHMVVQDAPPPLIGCSIGPWDYSFRALRETGECVIAVPAADLAEKAVEIGNCSGADLDKFESFGLTPVPAGRVQPPLIAECLANLECRVKDDSMLGTYNLLILEVVGAWIDPDRRERRLIHHNGNGTFTLDGKTLDLRDKMVKWPTYIA